MATRFLAAVVGITVSLPCLTAATILNLEPHTLVTQTVLEHGTRPGFIKTVVYPGTISTSAANTETFATGSFWRGFEEAKTGPDPPSALANSKSESRGVVGANGLIIGGGYPSFARATLEYQVLLVETAELPDTTPDTLPVPVTVNAFLRASASMDGESPFNAAFAFGYAVIAGHTSPRVVAHAPDSSFAVDTSTVVREFTLDVGQVIDVVLFTEARSVASAGPYGFTTVISEATAFIDPVFSFNQDAFDETARSGGFPTFDLSQYYAFQYSPGIGPAIPGQELPEPGSIAFALLGLGGIALRKWIACRMGSLPIPCDCHGDDQAALLVDVSGNRPRQEPSS
jgi:hypothetical protein